MIELPKMPSMRLDGKRAFVAGASSGIGLACASALAEAGAHVVLAARGKERLIATEEAFKSAGYKAESVVLDIADVDTIKAIIGGFEPFDILVNSAGLARHTPALETTQDDFDAVMNANVRGAHFLAVEIARGMVQAGKGGSIITISSQMGHIGGIDRSVYAATKHAVEGMTKSMAIEWGPHGIRVNTICPTFIRTPLSEQTFSNPERVEWIKQKIKLGRIGCVEDMMGPVVFLASDASALITGSALMVDGGWTAG